jgi:hypothetical protein
MIRILHKRHFAQPVPAVVINYDSRVVVADLSNPSAMLLGRFELLDSQLPGRF